MKIEGIRKLPEAEGSLRKRGKWKRMLQECSGNVQDEHRDDPSRIEVGRMPPSFRGREVRGPSCFRVPILISPILVSCITNAPN